MIAFFILLNNVPVHYDLLSYSGGKAMIFLPRTNDNRIVQTENTVYLQVKAYKFRGKMGLGNHWCTFYDMLTRIHAFE